MAFFGKKKSSEKTEKELEKEEQYRVQQEVLARRKNDSWQKDVITRRAKASRYLNDPAFKKICDAENREKFLANKALEDPEPKFGIIIPLIPVGMPEYVFFLEESFFLIAYPLTPIYAFNNERTPSPKRC